ncbi:hypothetical protein ACFLTM_03585 [Candidatus Bipolaricaulota bacterium]
MRKGFIALLIVVFAGVAAVAPCYFSDSPDCACFNNTATWNPSGPWIQDIAMDTVGTIVSCVTDGGKPFYQMRLGLNSAASATSVAAMLDVLSGIGMSIYDREAWCSETISYWHREAGIPYSTGYRRSEWHLDWQLTNTNAIRTFYKVEEILGAIFFFGGRGRWIEWSDLDYSDFRPGINAPAPGSYILIRKYDDSDATWDGKSHSMMIDEMTIHQNGFGEVVEVEITILEGNAGGPAQVLDVSSLDDLIAYTPGGSEWLSNGRKILGFGVDLDASRSPIYDPDRLHYERDLLVAARPFEPFPTKDPLWMRIYAPLVDELVEFATKTAGGPIVDGPGPVIVDGGIPDGHSVAWSFGPELDRTYPNGFQIGIDLLRDHPLLIEGIVLGWEGIVPSGYSVRYAADGGSEQIASPPDLAMLKLSTQPIEPFPVSIRFGDGEHGARVRTVELQFPPGAFAGEAKLTEMRFIYDWGPSDEAETNPPIVGVSEGGPLSLQLSASASSTPGADHSHILTVSWEISGGTPPYRLTISITGPDGNTMVESDEVLKGTREFELTYPDGGAVRVTAEVEDASGSVASGTAGASLSP